MIKMLARAATTIFILALTIPVIPASAAIASPDSLTLNSVNVYRNALELNDQLYLVTGNISYTVNPVEGTAYDLFLARLMDGATELKSVEPYAFYNDGYSYFVLGLYFSAAEVTAMGMGWGDGTGYSIRLDANPALSWTDSPPPSVSVGVFDSWYDGGTVAATTIQLTLKVRTLAVATENTWGVTLTELLAGERKFNTNGEDYFTTSIPNLRLMTPSLFSQSLIQPDFPEKGLVNIGYTGGDTTSQVVYGGNWAAQTFTTTESFVIGGVYVKYLRLLTPGDITLSIRATAAGEPDGADLAVGTLSANSGVTTVGAWDSVMFTTPYTLAADTQYAIVIRALAGDVNNSVGLRMDVTGAYSGGQVWTSVNAGAAWAGVAASDILFSIVGDQAHNLTWLQQWEGRLIGTPFDVSSIGNIFGWDRMFTGTVIWVIVALAFAAVVVRKVNSFKAGLTVAGIVMIIGGVFGISYAVISIALAILMPVGALFAIQKPSR